MTKLKSISNADKVTLLSDLSDHGKCEVKMNLLE